MNPRIILSALLVTTFAACTISDEPRDEAPLTARQLERLDALGIASVHGEQAMILLDRAGDQVGTLSHQGPSVAVELGAISAKLQRGGPGLHVECSESVQAVVLGAPSELTAWLDSGEVDPACARAIEIAAIITEIDSAHAPGCVTTEVDGKHVLDCSAAEEIDDDETFRLMANGQDCGCEEEWGGYCPAECWSCGQFCDPWGTGDPWGGGGGGGGGYDPEPPVPPCTPYGQDCSVARACCNSNVCAYGGERDTTWCQPLNAGQWEGQCVQARAGSTVYKNGSYCRTINGQETASTCHDVTNQRCVIGYNGDCGSGEYTIKIGDLAQVPADNCP